MMRIFHTIIEEFRELKTSNVQLRKFGFLVGGILLLFGALVLFFGITLHVTIPAIGVALVLLAFISPRLLLWPYYVWMGIPIVLGTFISPIFLALLFFGVLTPIGILKRIFSRPQKRKADTYWLPHAGSQDPNRMEKLF
jgi:hypothetical protein